MIPIEMSDLIECFISGDAKIIGKLNTQDLNFIQTAIIESGLLTAEQLELYFSK